MFPSPYGDYGSDLAVLIPTIRLSTPSFRPLTGIMVLTKSVKFTIHIGPACVSVPLRGLWFLPSLDYSQTKMM